MSGQCRRAGYPAPCSKKSPWSQRQKCARHELRREMRRETVCRPSVLRVLPGESSLTVPGGYTVRVARKRWRSKGIVMRAARPPAQPLAAGLCGLLRTCTSWNAASHSPSDRARRPRSCDDRKQTTEQATRRSEEAAGQDMDEGPHADSSPCGVSTLQ